MTPSNPKSKFKNAVKSGFARFGLEITSIDSNRSALPPVYEDLDEALYKKRIGLSVAYNCPLEKCVIPTGFSFSNSKFHPFVTAIEDISRTTDTPTYQGSFLEHYYQAWTPDSGRDVFAGFAQAPACLTSVTGFTVHAPWMEADPEDRQVLMERTIRYENAAAGEPDLPPSAGYGLHGPVTMKKGELEFERLIRIWLAIKNRGFDRTISKEDITAIAIERDGDYRFCIMHGQHRMAAMSALGFQKVPVNITKVVYYSEIEHWPQVYRGTWSLQQARGYIDHLFDFDSMRWAHHQVLLTRSKVSKPGAEQPVVSQAR